MKKIIVKQNEKFSCAVAAVLSIIKYYGGDISYDELAVIINNTKFGTNAFDMINGLKTIGFAGEGIKCKFKSLVKRNFDTPVIAHVLNGNMYHFVVIYGLDKKHGKFRVMDPSKGMIKIEFEEFEKVYLNTIINIYPVGEIPKINEKINYFKYFYDLFKKDSKVVLKIFVLSVVVILLSVISSLILRELISKNNIINYALVFLIVIFLKNILNLCVEKYVVLFEKKVGVCLNDMTLKHLFLIPNKYLKNKRVGDILERLREVEDFKSRSIIIVLNIFVNILIILFTLFVLYFINLKIFVITIIFLCFFLFISYLYSIFISRNINDVKESAGLYESELNESVINYTSIKNLNIEKEIMIKLINSYYLYVNKMKKFQLVLSKFNFLKNFVSEIFLLVLIVISIKLVSNGFLKIEDVIFLYSLAMLVIEPFKEIMMFFVEVKDIKVIFKRINDLLMIREEVKVSKEKIDGNIIVKNLSLSLAMNEIFSDKNFIINKGNIVLLYGESGTGKSSFLKILSKEIESYKGEVFINNCNLKDIDKSIINNSVVFVSQEEHLFSDTLENNIKLYRNISKKDYEKVLEVCLGDKIRDLKEARNNFVIFEDGVNLSGGERQKIILARALLKDANYIILDEALSEVNYEDEIEIIRRIRKCFFNKTIIYVTHKKEIINSFVEKIKFERG